jgi:hypothetical protein
MKRIVTFYSSINTTIFAGKKGFLIFLLACITSLGLNGAPFVGVEFEDGADTTRSLSQIERLMLEFNTGDPIRDGGFPPIWDVPVTSGGNVHGIIVMLEANPRVNEIPLNPGDYIGGFYTDDYGELRCGGATEWNGTENIIYSLFFDDVDTPEKDGFSYGEQIYFKFFSWANAKDYDVDNITFNTDGLYKSTDKWYPLGISQIIDMQALVDFDFFILASENPICIGNELYLSAEEFIGTGGPYTFDWTSEPPGFVSNLQIPPPFVPQETTTYFLTVADGLLISGSQLTVVVEELPQANAGEDGIVVGGEAFSLNGTASHYENIIWASSGDGVFDDPVSLSTFYTPGNMDIANGQTTITLFAYPLSSCPASASDDLLLLILSPEDEMYLNCGNYDFENEAWLPVLLDIEIGSYTSLEWHTNGDGYFDNPNTMPTNYFLGATDISNGAVAVFVEVVQQGVTYIYGMLIHIPGQLIQIENTGDRGISSYLDLSSMTMPEVLEPVAECLEIVFDRDGKYYWPETGINQVGNWSSTGYKAIFNCECCLPLYGEMLEDRTFEVSGAFCFLPVLSDFPVAITYLFAGHLNEIHSIYDYETDEYWTPDVADFNYLEPGKAYQLISTDPSIVYTIEFPEEDPGCNPWSPIQTSITHVISISLSANPNIDGEPLSEGDWIGVFYIDDAGNPKCGGATRWNESNNVAVIAYGDDITTQEKDGFATGEQIHWKIFDCSERNEYSAYATYDIASPDYDGLFQPFGLSNLLSLESALCQLNYFASGWNGVSLHVEPINPSVENIFSSFTDNYVIMQNLTSVYWPTIPVNTIGTWDVMSGYAIKFSSDVNIEVCGTELSSRELTLSPGWHYLPVLSECPVSIADIFDPFIDDIVLVKELIGTEVYWPELNIFSLQELIPGTAYSIKTSTELTLIYPECDKQGTSINHRTTNKVNSVWGEVQLMPGTHVVSIPGEVVDEFSPSDQIGVFDAGGTCFGVHEFSDSKTPTALLINGDDLESAEKDGFNENESLEFRHWKAATGEEALLEVSFDQSMPNTGLVFNNNGLSAITGIESLTTGLADLINNTDVNICPNPAKDEFLLSIINKNFSTARLTIYNLNGQMADAREISKRNTTIDIGNLLPGIYILNIQFENTVINKRFVKH